MCYSVENATRQKNRNKTTETSATHRENKMVKAKAKTKAVTTKKATKNVDWDFQNVGDNVRKNAEQISANIRANAEEISSNIKANSQRIGDNMRAYLNRNLG